MPALRGPDGKVIYLSDDDASGAIANGYVPVTQGTAGAAQSQVPAEDTGVIGAINSGTTGLLSGLTLGASDAALKAILDRGQGDTLTASREQHPWIGGASQLVGAVLPSIVAPESLLALTPSGLVGRAAAESIAAGKAVGGVAGFAQQLAAQGAEGAMQNAGVYISDAALGNRDLTAEGMAGALGMGFGFGAGTGVVAHGIEAGTIAARRMFARVAEGGEGAAGDAAAAWERQHQEVTEAYDQAATTARAKLVKARTERMQAGAARDRAAAGVADARVAAPELDAAAARARTLEENIGKVETGAQEAPIAGNDLDALNALAGVSPAEESKLTAVLAEHDAARSDLEAALRTLETPEVLTVEDVPLGEFGAYKGRTFKTSDEMAAIAAGTGGNEVAPVLESGTAVLPRGARGTPAGRSLGEIAAEQAPIRSAAPAEIPEYQAIKAHETAHDASLPQTVPASAIADHGYYEPPGSGADAIRNANANKAIIEGQRDPIKLTVSKDGKILVTDGRHRLAAAIELDAPVKVEWSVGSPPSATDVARGAATTTAAAPSATDSLTGLLRGTQEKLAAGEGLSAMGAPARAEYAAAKAERSAAASEHFRAEAKSAAVGERAGIGGKHRYSVKQLEIAHDAALERAASAADPVERRAATEEATKIEQQLTAIGKRPGAVEDVASVAPAVTRYEKASAELTEVLGPEAPPAAQASAKAFRDAEAAAERKTMDRTTRAIDQEAERVGQDRRPGATPGGKASIAAAKREKLAADAVFARARATESEAGLGARAAEQTARDARAPAPPEVGATTAPQRGGLVNKVIAGAKLVGVAGELGVPGVPHPKDIPVIGPLLDAYVKFRLLKAAAGRFVGRVPATAEARAASLAARTKDKIATAVDRSLGIVQGNMPTVRVAAAAAGTQVASALRRRAIDDGQPDAPKDASLTQATAVRIREVAATATNPQIILDKIREETKGISDPDLIASIEKHQIALYQYLNDTAPKAPPPNPYSMREWEPSTAAAMQWGRRLAVANDPTVALDALHNGTLTPEGADAFGKMWTQLFQMAQQRLIAQAANIKEPVSYAQRLRNSLLFGIPLDGSLEPENSAVLRSAYKLGTPASAPMPAPAGPPAPSIAAGTNLTALYQPTSDRRVQR